MDLYKFYKQKKVISLKSQKGITLTSVAIYIVLIFVVLGILSTVTLNFQNSVKDITDEGTEIAEINKFNMYFLQEVKKQGNAINKISENEIVFALGNKYSFKNNEIYLNDNIKIAKDIETCIFSSILENGKVIITVKIKAKNAEEQVIEYILNTEEIASNTYEDEENYTSYIPKDWEVLKLNSRIPVYSEIIDDKEYLVPIPNGFVISGSEEENTVENGLVIYQMTEKEKNEIDWTNSLEVETAKELYNQFVWIPVEEPFTETYTIDSKYSEPTNLTGKDETTGYDFDSQDELDYYYGINYYNLETEFNYDNHYKEMIESVNKYNGFYVGRYETTIDQDKKIGSKMNTTVLTSDKVLNEVSGIVYYYRWWGLYNSHRNSNDIKGNGQTVQSSMIWGQQWDAMVSFIGEKQYDVITSSETGVVKSGQSTDTSGEKDILNNIYDLRGNVYAWTAEQSDMNYRTSRTRNFQNNFSYAPADRHDIYAPIDIFDDLRY